MIAACHIRAQPHYRRDAFERGLKYCGYTLVGGGRPHGPEDLLVIWNRYGAFEAMANAWEAYGGTVLVCENGYIGADSEGRQLYAISAHGHNGSGWWPVGDEDRWSPLGIPLLPWVDLPEGHALVCGQRGIGSKTMASPQGWEVSAAAQVRKWHANVRVRPHPGRHAPTVPLDADLAGAAYCVIWSSSSGVKALTLGVPVIYDAPHWICKDSASELRRWPYYDTSSDARRSQALHRMAHAQWSVAEIEAGEPFARFRDAIEKRKAAA